MEANEATLSQQMCSAEVSGVFRRLSRRVRGSSGALLCCMTLLLSAGPVTAQTTERVNVSTAGAQTNGYTYLYDTISISPDGRYVAFQSHASNLVEADTNGQSDIFVHDRLTRITKRVSVSSSGVQGDGWSNDPSISADGRFVAFSSYATNLVPNDTNNKQDAFVRDLVAGTTTRVGGDSESPSISADGRFVVFGSIIRDRVTGTRENITGPNHYGGFCASLSADNRFVVFKSDGALVEDDTNRNFDTFVRDRATNRIERVSVRSSGRESQGGDCGSVSADGRFVAFWSNANDLVAFDTNLVDDIFVRDRLKGTTVRVSVSSAGTQANGLSRYATISADGRFVSFMSDSSNLVPGDTNDEPDIFVHDRLTRKTERASIDSGGRQADKMSYYYAPPNGDGRFLAFGSSATNLVANDTNDDYDVFVRDRGPIPDRGNDLLIDFGSRGLFERLNDSAWLKVHNSSPHKLAVGDIDGSLKEDAVASFQGAGLWARYDNANPWVKLHDTVPRHLITGDLDGTGSDEVIVDLGAEGLWARFNNAANWRKLQNLASQGMATGDLDGDGKDELIADLGSHGLWARRTSLNNSSATWTRLNTVSPVRIATGDLDGNGQDEVIADHGSQGLFARYNDLGTWTKIRTGTTQAMDSGDLDGTGQDDLVADLGASGLWAFYNNASWVKLDSRSPSSLVVTDLDLSGRADVAAGFAVAGLQVRYNNKAPWRTHIAWPQEAVTAGGFD